MRSLYAWRQRSGFQSHGRGLSSSSKVCSPSHRCRCTQLHRGRTRKHVQQLIRAFHREDGRDEVSHAFLLNPASYFRRLAQLWLFRNGLGACNCTMTAFFLHHNHRTTSKSSISRMQTGSLSWLRLCEEMAASAIRSFELRSGTASFARG